MLNAEARISGAGVSARDRIYEQIVAAESSPRKRRSLEIIWQALTALELEGANDFSLARVGRRVEQLGGPRTQSIRNQGGLHFRELIQKFAETIGATSKRTPLRPINQVQEAISQIPDLGVQTVLNMVLEEHRRLKAENDMLRNSYKELSIGAPAKQDCALNPAEVTVEVQERYSALDEGMVRSLQRFLSAAWLDERGFLVETDGSIIDTTSGNSMIAPPRFVDALKAAIET